MFDRLRKSTFTQRCLASKMASLPQHSRPRDCFYSERLRRKSIACMNKQKRKKALRRQTKRCFNALILAPRLSRIGSFFILLRDSRFSRICQVNVSKCLPHLPYEYLSCYLRPIDHCARTLSFDAIVVVFAKRCVNSIIR